MEYKYINTEYIDSVAGGDSETIREIVNLFREQSAEITAEMKSLLESHNYKSLGLLAHKAKSSVSIMGMENLAVMLKTFELQAREEKETHLYAGYVDRFSNEIAAAINEMEDLVRNL